MKVRLQHTHIFASDIEATLKFWQEMFGAQILFDAEMAGSRNVMIAIGSGALNIYSQPPRKGKGGAYHHLGIQTDDLDSLVEHMKSKGFHFQQPVKDYGFWKYVMALAPDNILLEIFQAIPEKAPAEMQSTLQKAFGFGEP
ncbi:MAG: VOC family protein [Chloroflexi bacterium]|nr:VOC family protein [Chloroflexota bacterium]MBM3175845.1 VOC family protein [Chloroflexota bacterium]